MDDRTTPTGLARFFGLLSLVYIALMGLYLLLRLTAGDSPWWLALLHNFAPLLFLPAPILLIITFLPGARRLTAWMLLIVLIGVVWFGPDFLPSGAQTSQGGPTVHLISFNVYPHQEQLVNTEAYLMEQNPYVILLQEAGSYDLDRMTPALLARYPHRMIEDRPRGRIILSRLPFIETDPDDPATPWQRVVLDLNGQAIALYNVHLLMPLRETPWIQLPLLPEFITRYDETARNAQITDLIAAIQDEPLPYIVAGDFNMASHALIYRDLAATMQDAFAQAGVGFGNTWPAGSFEELAHVSTPLMRIDYVWHSASWRTLAAQTGPAGLGSDHLPLSVVLELVR